MRGRQDPLVDEPVDRPGADTELLCSVLEGRHRIGRTAARVVPGEPVVGARSADAFLTPLRRAMRLARGQRTGAADLDEEIWALQDVSFEIRAGEVVGVIGRNGAGKTTLLKILSRITEPTCGWAETHGQVGSLLQVGAGFHPELTGKENIYLNGAILGMRKSEIVRKFDDIVSFAEVEQFIHTPIKHYSSGMYVRLAFAVAAHLEPDILLVDEVLAVGDLAFQRKCLGKMSDVASEGRTVIFVSHNMAAVQQLCEHGILLEDGCVVEVGPIDDVINTYLSSVIEFEAERTFPTRPDAVAHFDTLSFRRAEGERTWRFASTETIVFEIEYTVNQRSAHDHIFILLYRVDGVLLFKGSDDDLDPPHEVVREPGRYRCRFQFPGGLLNEGKYRVTIRLGSPRGVYHDEQTDTYFEVYDGNDYSRTCQGRRSGVLRFPIDWDETKVE